MELHWEAPAESRLDNGASLRAEQYLRYLPSGKPAAAPSDHFAMRAR
jgi:hypothetical protein